LIGRSHLIFGVGSLALTNELIGNDLVLLVAGLGPAMLGSLMPDIDAYQSKIKSNRIIWLLSLPFTLFGHRTWTHSGLILLLLVIPWFYLNGISAFLYLSFWVGYTSHLVGDMMTPHGIPLLYPYKKKFRLPITFKTNSPTESLIAVFPGVFSIFIHYTF